MSERKKRDRYNETWTADELTSSLKKSSDKRSSRKDDKHHKKDDDIYSKKEKKKERRERPEDDRGHKSSSSRQKEYNDEGRHQTQERRAETDNGERRRDKDRRDRVKERPPSHDRRKEKRDDKERYGDTNGDGKSHSREKRDKDERHRERSHKSDRHSTKYEEDRKNRRDERDYDEDRKKHKDRKRHEEDDARRRNREDEKRDKRKSYRDDEYEERRRRHRNDEVEEGDRRERHHKRREKEDQSRSARHDDYERSERHERQHRQKQDETESDDRRRKREKEKHRNEDDHERSRRKNREKEREGSRDQHRDNEKHERSSRHHNSDATRLSEKPKDQNSTYIVDKDDGHEKPHQEEEYNYDDERFEDYDDDFDDDGDDSDNAPPQQPIGAQNAIPSEMELLKRAIEAENERANSVQTSSRMGSSGASDRGSPYSVSSSMEGKFRLPDDEASSSTTSKSTPAALINFAAAKNLSAQSKTMRRVLKRRKDLSNLIQLDTVSFDIVDMAPVTEYNLYIKNYGNSNMSQASTQCNDDNLEQDSQTDVPDVVDKWSQHPPHDIKCVGGGVTADMGDDSQNEDRERMLSMMQNDSKRLGSFMSHACKLVEAILVEDELWEKSAEGSNRKSQLSFCDGFVSLETNLAYLQGRKVIHVECSPESDVSLVAVAFEPASTSFSTRIDRKGVVVVWDSRKPTIPEKLLVCDANPTCCCFSPTRSYILFIGTDDGCVLAYDLREPGTYHQVVSLVKTRETILRSPTYSTGYLTDGHSSPIVSLTLAGREAKIIREDGISTNGTKNGIKQMHTGLAFQLASLEEAANLCIWVVVELAGDSDTDSDMGLAPHGKIKLLKSLNVQIQPPIKSHISDLPFRATCVQFSVTDPNHFYVGTDTGHVVHCTQYSSSSAGGKGVKKSKDSFVYYNELNTVSAVTELSINPFQCFGASLILAGFNDGTLRLYLSDREIPVLTWPFTTEGASVIKLQWSTSRPSVFFVLDSANRLHIWDLAILDTGPIKTEHSGDKKISHFSLSNADESSKRPPEIALIYEPGPKGIPSAAEVHKLSPHFSQITDTSEMEQLSAFLQSML